MNKEQFIEELKKINIKLSDEQIEKLNIYKECLIEYNEHTNDHQLEIMNEFYNQGYLLKLEEMKDLGKVLKEVETFKPKKYVSNNQNMIKIIEDYISTVI